MTDFKYKEWHFRKSAYGDNYIFKFQNRLGASVLHRPVPHKQCEDCWNLTSIKFSENGEEWAILQNEDKYGNWDLGWLTTKAVNHKLDEIRSLKR